jgi:type VI secretion system protein ImpM
MRCGLFGKLPAKRDFVAVSTPRAFLSLWEPWLEKGLVAARTSEAAGDFASAYASAPIWRFWLGPALCGEAIVGAFMPSVDALGRMFPLTLIGTSAVDDLAPPDIDPREAWFAQVEDLLLDALDPGTPFETTVARLDALSARETGVDAPARDATARAFAAMRAEDRDCPAEAATFWWTIGGADCPPRAMMRRAMPAPASFVDMLSRRIRLPDPEATSAGTTAQPG